MRAAMLTGTLVAILFAGGTIQAHSASGSGSSSHYYGSRSSGSRSSGSSHSSGSTRTALPPGTKFIKKTCKTASCKAKHPTGEYMVPIKPKKNES